MVPAARGVRRRGAPQSSGNPAATAAACVAVRPTEWATDHRGCSTGGRRPAHPPGVPSARHDNAGTTRGDVRARSTECRIGSTPGSPDQRSPGDDADHQTRPPQQRRSLRFSASAGHPATPRRYEGRNGRPIPRIRTCYRRHSYFRAIHSFHRFIHMALGVHTQSISNLPLTLAPIVDNAGRLWRVIDRPDERSSEWTDPVRSNRTHPVRTPDHAWPRVGPVGDGQHESAAQRAVARDIFQPHRKGL